MQRRDAAAGWTPPIQHCLNGELGYEKDTGKFKMAMDQRRGIRWAISQPLRLPHIRWPQDTANRYHGGQAR